MSVTRTKEYYEELILIWASESFGLSLPEASKKLDECLKLIAFRKKLKYADVYDTIYSPQGISSCLAVKGPIPYKQEDCEADCRYIWYKNKCYPRFFPDADEMNEDPDTYVKNHVNSLKELEDLVEIASYLYYNFEGGGITDNTFDAFEYILKTKFNQRNRRYEKIGAPPVDRIRTKLPYHMGSLDKIKPSQQSILSYLSKPLVWSQKLDGVSALIVYGDSVKIYTRGDGEIGGDVSFLSAYIKIPTLETIRSSGMGIVAVRGELIMSIEKFEKYAKSYSNPRSLVASKVNSGCITQGLEDIDFVAYEVVDKSFEMGIPDFGMLELSGFKVVKNGVLENPTIFDLAETYKENRNNSIYRIDGLVVVPDDGSLPKVAFKMPLESQVRWSKITKIEWNVSRYGKLIPTAIYESVFVDGSRLHRASAHSAKKVKDWGLCKGAKVRIIKSGDIIPTITEVISECEPEFPPEDYEGGWVWKGAHLVVKNPETNLNVRVKEWSYFFEIANVPRLREKTLKSLQNAGFETLQSIVQATPAQLSTAKGIGPKKSEAFHRDIHISLSSIRLDRMVIASGLIEGIGRKLIRLVTESYPFIFEDDTETIRKRLQTEKIKGIGPVRITQFSEGIPKVMAFFYNLSKEDCSRAIQAEKRRQAYLKQIERNPLINNRSFTFTGFWGNVDYDLEDYVLDNGGSIESEVKEDCAAVIVANILAPSEKAQTARRRNIPVLTLEEFYQRFQIPSELKKDLESFVRDAGEND